MIERSNIFSAGGDGKFLQVSLNDENAAAFLESTAKILPESHTFARHSRETRQRFQNHYCFMEKLNFLAFRHRYSIVTPLGDKVEWDKRTRVRHLTRALCFRKYYTVIYLNRRLALKKFSLSRKYLSMHPVKCERLNFTLRLQFTNSKKKKMKFERPKYQCQILELKLFRLN